MKVPHLVQYQGSKRNLAAEILKYFPSKINRLIEPFAGTAAITLACATKKMSNKFVINDLNKPLINLMDLLVSQPEFTANRYEEIWKGQYDDSIEHYYQIRERFNLTHDPIMLLYLLARCVKGAVRYNSDGMFNQNPDKRRHGTIPKTMRTNIFGISTLLKNKAEFFSLDYKTILEMARPGDVLYMDPPYQGVCGDRDSRYFAGIDHDEFVNELDKLKKRKISYIVSYDGKYGERSYGEILIPPSLHIQHVQLNAGKIITSNIIR